jgi:hypothetical protein
MSKYKSVYPSESALGQAFSTKSFSPKGDLFRTRNGSSATHTTIETTQQFIARWDGNTLFKTRFAGYGQQPLWGSVTTAYYQRDAVVKPKPCMWRIYELAPCDSYKEMLQKQLECARKTFTRAKRARVHNQMYYYNCAVELFNECVSFANAFQLMPPSKNDIPEDFESFPVIAAFKLKAEGKVVPSHYTLSPYYTSTLSPSQSVAA